MRGLLMVGLGVFALAGGAHGQDAGSPPAQEPGFRYWSTGSGLYVYHQLSADCDGVEHGHGRNAVWGRWRMPLAEILEDGPEEASDGGAVLRFRCADGSACMEQGAYLTMAERTDEHSIPFETMEGARRFATAVANLKIACGIEA